MGVAHLSFRRTDARLGYIRNGVKSGHEASGRNGWEADTIGCPEV